MNIINNYDPEAPDKEKLSVIFNKLNNKLKEYKEILQGALSRGYEANEGINPISGEQIQDYEYQKCQKKIETFKNEYMGRRWNDPNEY